MNNFVHHYTSLDALTGIIGNDICLWASRYDHMNDPHEQIWAKDVVLKYCKNLPEAEGVTDEFIQNWFAKYTYIISLCDIPDYRNMWRLYCNDGLGVCLTFGEEFFEEQSTTNQEKDSMHTFDVYDKVVYASKKEIHKAVDYWIGQGTFKRFSNEPFDEYMNLCAFIKDSDFDIEHEMRYARIRDNTKVSMNYNPQKPDSYEETFHSNNLGVKYRTRGRSEVVPYIDIHFPPEILKQITIGYRYKDKETIDFIRNHLNKYGESYKSVEILSSSLF